MDNYGGLDQLEMSEISNNLPEWKRWKDRLPIGGGVF